MVGQCDECRLNSSLALGTCSCLEGFYDDGTGCRSCHKECLGCNGPSNQQCTSCKQNSNLTGVATCECWPGFYLKDSACAPCSGLCLKCSSLVECLDCEPNSDLINAACFCKQGFFYFEGKCIKCHDRCDGCFAGDESSCLSCKNNSSLLDKRCICNLGLYWNGTSLICDKCDNLCLNCTSLFIMFTMPSRMFNVLRRIKIRLLEMQIKF